MKRRTGICTVIPAAVIASAMMSMTGSCVPAGQAPFTLRVINELSRSITQLYYYTSSSTAPGPNRLALPLAGNSEIQFAVNGGTYTLRALDDAGREWTASSVAIDRIQPEYQWVIEQRTSDLEGTWGPADVATTNYRYDKLDMDGGSFFLTITTTDADTGESTTFWAKGTYSADILPEPNHLDMTVTETSLAGELDEDQKILMLYRIDDAHLLLAADAVLTQDESDTRPATIDEADYVVELPLIRRGPA